MAKTTEQLTQLREQTFIANAESRQSGWAEWLRQSFIATPEGKQYNGFEITDEPKAATAIIEHYHLIRDGEQIYQG